jgi:transposase
MTETIQTSADSLVHLGPDALSARCHKLTEKIDILTEENERLLGYVRLLKKHLYGSRSEKIPAADPDQRAFGFFDEAASPAPDPESPEDKPEESSSETPGIQKKGGRRPLPQHLPREQVIHDLCAADKVCGCGHDMHKIGEETSQQLDYVPASLRVIEHVRYKYGCKACEGTVRLAPNPLVPLPKSMATPGLLAHVLVSKFQDHLPLYRQSAMWKRLNIDLSRATLGNWVMDCGDLLSPLVNLLKQEIITSDYIQADETTVQVLAEDNRKATTKSYMWLYLTGRKDKKCIVYDYQPTRESKNATHFLTGFKGYLQADGYAGYNAISSKSAVTRLGCWAHARRKFVEVMIMANSKTGKAAEAVQTIKKLYDIEAAIKNFPPGDIKQRRLEKAKPILDTFKTWLTTYKDQTLPKSPLGQAISYSLNQWTELTRYLDDGRLEIDNNAAERSIRPFAVGRRNWLFMGNVAGANSAATIYSLIETCKANDVNPYEYLRLCPDAYSINAAGKLTRSLLPWNCQIDPVSNPERKNRRIENAGREKICAKHKKIKTWHKNNKYSQTFIHKQS